MNGYICKHCKSYLLLNEFCKCKPHLIEHDGEEIEVYGFSEQDSAERYAEIYDSDDHDLVGNEMDILVNGIEYTIGAECTIDYSARKKEVRK